MIATTPSVRPPAISGAKSRSCSPIVELTPTNARCASRATNDAAAVAEARERVQEEAAQFGRSVAQAQSPTDPAGSVALTTPSSSKSNTVATPREAHESAPTASADAFACGVVASAKPRQRRKAIDVGWNRGAPFAPTATASEQAR